MHYLLLTLLIMASPHVFAKDKPAVAILATGGTIAGAANSSVQAGYSSGQVGVKTLLDAVPQLADIATISGEQLANVGSQDISIEIWLKLATRINALLAQDNIDAVVITHGTDTLEETAYFLQLTVNSDKPVVLTAAMRPATALSADGPLNLFNAVAVAADPAAIGRGVLVVINDDIHGARAVTKTSTTDVQTFKSTEKGLIGTSLYGSNSFYRGPYKNTGKRPMFDISGVSSLPRVDVIYAGADTSADLIDAAVKLGARGIVIAGVGNGNMNKAMRAAASKAVAQGVSVVRASRVPFGTVGRNVEVNDDKEGTIAALELNPAKARILLMMALASGIPTNKMQEQFELH
jgi:L-asparaginase